MGNQQLLNEQLQRLEDVSRHHELHADDRVVTYVNSKRADLVMRLYDDLMRQPRYKKAVSFLANDLLGDSNLITRGDELMRAKKPMVRMLPDALLGTVARSVEFTAKTLEIDLAIAREMVKRDLTHELSDEDYLACVRAGVPRQWLEAQTALVVKIGREIESVVNRPFISTALKMCRTPAHMMGLDGLQDFLERGFDAFRSMRGADDFINTFSQRESDIIERIYTTQSNPFPVI